MGVTMKFFLIAIAFLNLSLFASDCSFRNPIPLSTFHQQGKFVLHNIVLNQEPTFKNPDNYNSETDTLNLNLFKLGESFAASISVDGKAESIGFATQYPSGTPLTGEEKPFHGKMIYTTNLKIGNEYTTVWLAIENDALIYVMLRHPLYAWTTTQQGNVLTFTGKHEMLCVYDGEL